MSYAPRLQRYSTAAADVYVEAIGDDDADGQQGAQRTCVKDIYQASIEGDVECIEANIKLGVDINKMGQPRKIWGPRFEKAGLFYATPLCYACSYGREDAVKLLLAHGARTDVRSACGWTCTEYAKRRNYISIVTMLSSAESKDH